MTAVAGGLDCAPPTDQRNEPEEVQPGEVVGENLHHSEEQTALHELRCDFIVRLHGMGNATERELARQGQSTHGGVQSQGASAESLPTQGETTKDPAAEGKSSRGKKSHGRAAPWDQADSDAADTERGQGETAESEKQTEGEVTTGNPCFNRSALGGRAVKPEMDERQSEQLKLRAIFPAGLVLFFARLRGEGRAQFAKHAVRPGSHPRGGDDVSGNKADQGG